MLLLIKFKLNLIKNKLNVYLFLIFLNKFENINNADKCRIIERNFILNDS